ncbi:uncharacterized protein BYT42DRAFT_552309 [Radiomyces spectabilis]|uniref:uncharacterized protein n=1 Tax=Radiomyces spectabilis TaxID=64574 RepID=UPI00221ED072|nr:uncharacterized protein BYT42DRAFT_552309 [Radiomyces spectabilis]KAI8393812.1 hypothetical protein BYT42DRAFT_552309 [Radiomyces spectabilis]
MQLANTSSHSTLITLHDAVKDSPVFRASVYHFDEQLELLEKWLDSVSKQVKLYCDKLNKFNLETNALCKKAIPHGLDEALIDPNFTGAVIKSFSDALQTSLAFKTKLVTDLEDNFIQPLHQFVKTHLKEIKDFRKQHDKALERYETQLSRYASQSKAKEVSAVREEAFRLHEARKAYIRLSGQYVVRILHFRSLLEHVLVERFSFATMAHLKDFDGGMEVWQSLTSSLASWKQWLIDDKGTCNYQLHALQMARKKLEDEYISQTQPPRDLEKYTPIHGPNAALNSRHSLDFSTVLTDQTNHKWGYLLTRGSRNYWNRKWFFLYDGYFGYCNINNSAKVKGAITAGLRVSVLLCEIKPMQDIDRRFCFEVLCAQQAPIALQAETEEEMRDWLASFEKAKRLMLQNEELDLHTLGQTADPGSLSAASDPSTPRPSMHQISETKSGTKLSLNNSSTTMPISAMSSTSTLAVSKSSGTSTSATRPSIVMLSTSPEHQNTASLDSAASLTPLLAWEAARAAPTTSSGPSSVPSSPAFPSQSVSFAAENPSNGNSAATNQPFSSQPPSSSQQPPSSQTSSWGIPWTLVPSMFHNNNEDTNLDNPLSPTGTGASNNFADVDGCQIIWPTQHDDSNTPKVDLTGYDPSLEVRNRELRHLFGGVATHEVVLDTFLSTLKKKPQMNATETKLPEPPSSPVAAGTGLDTLEQEFSLKLQEPVTPPLSEFGYSYTGRAFITQEAFWFYSCIMMTCVNTVAIRLKDISSVRLIRDPSIVNTGNKNHVVLAIDLVNHPGSGEARDPVILSTLMDDIDVVAEKLRFAVDNAKNSKPVPLQTMYDILHHLSAAKSKSKNQPQVTTIIKSEPSKVRSSPDLFRHNHASADLHSADSAKPPIPSKSTEKKKRAHRKSSGSSKPVIQPKSALAAAMMAATVTGSSGFFDANKVARLEEGHRQAQKQGKSKHHDPESESKSTEDDRAKTASPPSEKSVEGSSGKDDDELPSHIQAPSGPCSCECEDHLEKREAEVELPISAKALYELLFSEEQAGASVNGGIWERKSIDSGCKDIRVTEWSNAGGQEQRSLKYIMPVNNPMVKVKETEVNETQVLLRKDDYIRYVVQISTKADALPYADAFIPSIRYCITWVSKSQCKLTCHMGVKFIKSLMVKGLVSKAALKGMSESIAKFVPLIEEAANNINAKKHGGSSQQQKGLSHGASLKRSAHVSMKRKNTSTSDVAQPTSDNGWLGMLKDGVDLIQNLITSLPLYVNIGLAVLFFLYMISVWMRAGTSIDHLASVPSNQIVWRAVYLRDIEDGLLKSKVQPAYAGTKSFQQFLEMKASTNETHIRRWHSSQYHQLAVELMFSRERVAMLRHDTLVIFQLLNEVDAHLLENEYMNWLLDSRLECHDAITAENVDRCEETYHQLKSLSR